MSSEASVKGIFPVKFAKIVATTVGNTSLVSAVAGRTIRVINYAVISDTAQAIKFTDTSGDLTGAMTVSVSGGLTVHSEAGVFETTKGEPLNINLAAISVVGGHIAYIEVP